MNTFKNLYCMLFLYKNHLKYKNEITYFHHETPIDVQYINIYIYTFYKTKRFYSDLSDIKGFILHLNNAIWLIIYYVDLMVKGPNYIISANQTYTCNSCKIMYYANFFFKCSREIYELFISVLYKVINVYEVSMQICKNKET